MVNEMASERRACFCLLSLVIVLCRHARGGDKSLRWDRVMMGPELNSDNIVQYVGTPKFFMNAMQVVMAAASSNIVTGKSSSIKPVRKLLISAHSKYTPSRRPGASVLRLAGFADPAPPQPSPLSTPLQAEILSRVLGDILSSESPPPLFLSY